MKPTGGILKLEVGLVPRVRFLTLRVCSECQRFKAVTPATVLKYSVVIEAEQYCLACLEVLSEYEPSAVPDPR